MALFSISRYMGDEEESSPTGKTSQASEILRRIHQAAKTKQSLQQQTKSITNGKSPTTFAAKNSSPETPSKSAKKKRKRSLTSSEEKGIVAGEKETQHDKKKRKKNKSDLSLTELESDDSVEESFQKQSSENSDRRKTKKKVNGSSVSPKSSKQFKKQNIDPKSDSDTNNQISTKDKSPDVPVSDSEDEKVKDDVDTPQEENHETKVQKAAGQRHAEVGGFTVIGDVRQKKTPKVHRVLPDWLANPSVVAGDLQDQSHGLDYVTGLDEDIKQQLKENNITYFFPGSGHLIGTAGYRPSDICCSAPTGSGKTLAFVLPIVQTLRHRVVRKVRALVVLPVRDLATQVFKVFTTYCQGTTLKVGLIIGQKVFSTEQQSLVKNGPSGQESMVDIVVATPGRLVDHIKQTQGFSLQHLRYLVIDEADRMMDEIKQDWLSLVEAAVFSSDSRPRPLPTTAANANQMHMPLQKLLFSATLSQNPEKLQQLNLFYPKLFTSVVDNRGRNKPNSGLEGLEVSEKSMADISRNLQADFIGKYTTPAGLTEYFVPLDNVGQKPLIMLSFLHHYKFRQVLCFTNSVESTHRLYLLLKLVGGVKVCEFSSSLHAIQRKRILKRFETGKIDILICSDAMARGMDLDNVKYVVCYDPVQYVKTYIHRIGRTARAGKTGSAFTLLEKKEIFHFKKMLKEAGKTDIQQLKISMSSLKNLVDDYETALKQLPQALRAERKSRR